MRVSEIQDSDSLYLLQGSLNRGRAENPTKFTRLGMYPNTLPKNKEIFLVYRLERLALKKELVQIFLQDVYQWSRHENQVAGIQLDFDSPTHGLDQYIAFLKEIREELPSHFRLSVTGLADWPATGNLTEIREIAEITDEIVFQLYAGRSPVKNLNRYLEKFATLKVRFKLGILESMKITTDEFTAVEKSPFFEGYVVFSLK